MADALLISLILSKIRRLKIKYLFYSWTFYPVLLTQVLLIFFQASVFWGTYYFIRFASAMETAIILSFLFPMLVFKLYKPAMLGSGSIIFGTILNKFVILQNGGKMPAYPSLSYLTGYVKPEAFGVADSLHVLGSEATKFKFLTDYIDLGYSILSPGDVFIHLFSYLMLYYTVKAVNIRYNTSLNRID